MADTDPITREEWQQAVDFAHTGLLIDSARQYGLITGGPEIDLERCEELLRRGADQGIWPRRNAVDLCLPTFLTSGERPECPRCGRLLTTERSRRAQLCEVCLEDSRHQSGGQPA